MIENLSSRAARCASFSIAGSCLLLFALAAKAEPVSVKVTIQNLAPANGTYLTPLWVGFHNGTFRLYTTGAPVSPSFERLVEDGNTDSISLLFRTSAAGIGGKDGVIIGPTMPGAIAPRGEEFDLVPRRDNSGSYHLARAGLHGPHLQRILWFRNFTQYTGGSSSCTSSVAIGITVHSHPPGNGSLGQA